MTNARYEIKLSPETGLPRSIKVLLLTGRKGETDVEKKKIVGGRHVAFHFLYKFRRFGRAEELEIPKAAGKLLASK